MEPQSTVHISTSDHRPVHRAISARTPARGDPMNQTLAWSGPAWHGLWMAKGYYLAQQRLARLATSFPSLSFIPLCRSARCNSRASHFTPIQSIFLSRNLSKGPREPGRRLHFGVPVPGRAALLQQRHADNLCKFFVSRTMVRIVCHPRDRIWFSNQRLSVGAEM